MKISVINIGPNDEKYLEAGIEIYRKRLGHYIPFEMVYLNELRASKKLPGKTQKEKEGKLLLERIALMDYPVLLDEKGKTFTSVEFSGFIQTAMNRGLKHMGFVIGGSYGFSDAVYHAVPEKISLSGMTFSHQMVRLIFLEQLYRALTILNNEAYHHP